jgi:hypothetical protein
MNRRLAGLLIVFLALCLSGCRQPVGSISPGSDGSGGNGNGVGNPVRNNYEFLMLRPNRILYEADGGADGRFDRLNDLRVFVADNGEFIPLASTDPALIIEVIENPGMSSEAVTAVNTHFPFALPGRHLIRGTYHGFTDEYSIEVRGTYVNPGDGSEFVDIIWL